MNLLLANSSFMSVTTPEYVCPDEVLGLDIDGNVLHFDGQFHKYHTAKELYVIFREMALPYNDIGFSPIGSNKCTGNETYLQFLEKQCLIGPGEVDGRETLRRIVTLLAYTVTIVISVFGNALILFIILSRPHFRAQTTNKLIVNLTISDGILTLVNVPLTLVRLVFDSWPLGSLLCQLGPLVQAMSVYVSTITMVVIALDRQQVLLGSFSPRLASTLGSRLTLLFIWLLSGLFSLPHFLFNRVVYRQTIHACIKQCGVFYPTPGRTYSRTITFLTVSTQYLIPLVISAICYYRIGVHIWKRAHIGVMPQTPEFSHLQARKRTIAMLVLVVVNHALSYLPLTLYQLYWDTVSDSHYSKEIFTFCHWLGVSSACFNPFIYFWLNKQYKHRATNILAPVFTFRWPCCRRQSAKLKVKFENLFCIASYDSPPPPENYQQVDLPTLINASLEPLRSPKDQEK